MSILPMAFFVERIGGEYVSVHVLIGPGLSPEMFEPTSKQLVQLARSRVFFSIGVPFEKQILSRIQNNFKTVEVANIRNGIPLRSTGEHPDPHIWLSPRLAKILSRNIRDALVRIDPTHDSVYNKNCEILIADLEKIDREIKEVLAPLEGARLYVFHPAYGYFAHEYGLVQVPIETGGSTPGSKHLAALIERAKAQSIQAIFVQPQFSRTGALTIASEIGAEVVVLDPLSRDYLVNLKKMALEIQRALDIP